MKNLLLLFMLISTITKAQPVLKNMEASKKKSTKGPNRVMDDLGASIITFSPVSITMSATDQDAPDLSVSLAYEHISKNGYLGFKLPVVASLYNPYYTFMPAVKLYPGRQGVAKYAIGPQLVMATGKVTVANYNQTTQMYDLLQKQRSQFGFALNNSFNFTIARHMFVGIDLGIGVIYYDNQPNAVYDVNSIFFNPSVDNNNNISPFMQMGFSMGYRF